MISESRVVRVDDGWGRVVSGELTSYGERLVIHLVAADDDSPAHRMYPTGYDHRCSWCWLGAAHSEAAHLASVMAYA